MRAASYVAPVRIREGTGDIEVGLGLATESDVLPAHWGFFGGGREERLTLSFRPPSLRRVPEHPHQTARREVRQETRRKVAARNMELALMVVTGSPVALDQRQQTHVYAIEAQHMKNPRSTREMREFRWFTLNEAIEHAARGTIIDMNVLLGIQAVMEWYLIQRLGVEADERLKLTRKTPDDFLVEVANLVSKRRKELGIDIPPLSDTLEL
jgi:8-oxo-dGTP pyrophosphatase MutT (NUDIX family)